MKHRVLIYFIEVIDRGSVKIGHTAQMSVRFYQHKVKYGESIRVLGVMRGGRPVERKIHSKFDHLRISNKDELFRPDAELRAYIRENTESWSESRVNRGISLRLDSDLVSMSKYVALHSGSSVDEVINCWLRPIIEREFRKAGRDILETEE